MSRHGECGGGRLGAAVRTIPRTPTFPEQALLATGPHSWLRGSSVGSPTASTCERCGVRAMGTRIFLLSCGTADLDQSTVTPGRGAGGRVRVPMPAYLLQTDGRTILFDTGMPDFCYTGDPRALAHDGEPDPPWAIPYGGEADTISGQLATIGLRPADVDLVVNSHLHLDHCGGNLHFAHCPLLLQGVELEAARAPGGPYQGFTGWNEP